MKRSRPSSRTYNASMPLEQVGQPGGAALAVGSGSPAISTRISQTPERRAVEPTSLSQVIDVSSCHELSGALVRCIVR